MKYENIRSCKYITKKPSAITKFDVKSQITKVFLYASIKLNTKCTNIALHFFKFTMYF